MPVIRQMKTKLPEHEIRIDLDNPKHEEQLHRWGGKTLARLVIYENGKRVVAFLSARKSGDIRAGRTDGLHLTLTVNRRGTESTKSAHAKPWLAACKRCDETAENCTCMKK